MSSSPSFHNFPQPHLHLTNPPPPPKSPSALALEPHSSPISTDSSISSSYILANAVPNMFRDLWAPLLVLASFLSVGVKIYVECHHHCPEHRELAIAGWFVCFITYVHFYRYARLVRFLRFNSLKMRHGFNNHSLSYIDMTVDQAQEVYRNLAEHDFPFLFEFGWIFNFLKTATAPCLSKVIIDSGHFCSTDTAKSHARQQDTVNLMTAMMAQPFHSANHALAIARINEHHHFHGPQINSDTVLWLSDMWMQGPIDWINRCGWRELEDFEVHAMFVLWRELSVMMGCKWVPNTLAELKRFRAEFVEVEQYPSTWNTIFSDAMIDAIIYTVPGFLKKFARKCVIALLDDDVRRCNKYDHEFSPKLREYLITVMQLIFSTWQANWSFARSTGRVLTPTTANQKGLFNFPEYTFPNTPYYVEPTFMNRWGLAAIIKRLRGLPIPGAEWSGQGTSWESMGSKRSSAMAQHFAEEKVRTAARTLMNKPFGYRPRVEYQKKSIVVDASYGRGYGNHNNMYTQQELQRKGRTNVEVHERDL